MQKDSLKLNIRVENGFNLKFEYTLVQSDGGPVQRHHNLHNKPLMI